LVTNHLGQLWIPCHVCYDAGQCLAQGAAECTEQRPDRSLQVPPQAARIGSWIASHLADDCVRHQVAFAGPTAINARPGSPDPLSNAFHGDGLVTFGPQYAQNGGHDLAVNALVARTAGPVLGSCAIPHRTYGRSRPRIPN